MNKNTIVVNLYGGQGTGKSTTMAGVFYYLKNHGVDCEMTPEFAKELVWEGRKETFQDELYLFAKQNHRLHRVNGKVDVIITDHPLEMNVVYNKYYRPIKDEEWNDAFSELVWQTARQYKNVNIILNRVKPYNPNGRNETEEQARNFDLLFMEYLIDNEIDFISVDADIHAAEVIGEKILKMLEKN